MLQDLFLPAVFIATAVLGACSGTATPTLPNPTNIQPTATTTTEATATETPKPQSTSTPTPEIKITREDAYKIKSEIGVNADKKVFAVYLDWFGQSKWNDWAHWEWSGEHPHDPRNFVELDKRDIASANYPLIGPYRSDDPKLIRYHTKLAKAIGIDALVVDWYTYKDTLNTDLAYMDRNFSRMMDIAEEEDYTLSVIMEPKIHFNGWVRHGSRGEAVKAVEDDFRYVLTNYSKRKGFLKQDELPVLFVFETSRLNPGEWKSVVDDLEKEGRYFIMVSDNTDPSYLNVFNSFYEWPNYEAVSREGNAHHESVLRGTQGYITGRKDIVPAAAVWPGFNDTGVWGWGGGPRVLDRKNGEFYQSTWDAALENNSKWITLATFNDWNEGTQIEPSMEDNYKSMTATTDYISKFKGIVIDASKAIRLTQDYLAAR